MQPLVVTGDPELAETLVRLAAVGGLEPRVAGAQEAAGAWAAPPLVLVDDRLATELGGLPRRRGIVVVCHSGEPEARAWQAAVALGAEHVVALPAAERWLIDRFAECTDGPSRDGRAIGVLGAVGGAGASTTALGLASAARQAGLRTLLVDGDPNGGGLDLLLGAEHAPGARWPDLGEVSGRLGAGSLDAALPHPDGFALLSWGRAGGASPSSQTWASIIDAGVRGQDLVLVDLLRGDPSALASLTQLVLVMPAAVRATAAAAVILAEHSERISAVAIRSVRGGLDAATITRSLAWTGSVVEIPHSRAVAESTELGDPLPTGDAWAKACARLLRHLHPVEH